MTVKNSVLASLVSLGACVGAAETVGVPEPLAVGSIEQASVSLDNGTKLLNGFKGTNGTRLLNGHSLPNGTRLLNGPRLLNSLQLGNGVHTYNGSVTSNGTRLLNGLRIGNGTRLLNGTTTPAGVTVTNTIEAADGYIVPANGSELDLWLKSEPANNLKVLQYLVQCALPSSKRVYVQHGGNTNWFTGLANLGPSWASGEMTTEDAERVSACMLARVNALGQHVPIELEGSYGALAGGVSLQAPLNCTDSIRGPEAVFWGNVFPTGTGTARAYMCRTDLADTYGMTRACGLDCGDDLIQDLGRCDDLVNGAPRCTRVTGTGGSIYYTKCKNPDGSTTADDRIVTAWRSFCQATSNKTWYNVSGTTGSTQTYTVVVPAGGGGLSISLRGGTGDPYLDVSMTYATNAEGGTQSGYMYNDEGWVGYPELMHHMLGATGFGPATYTIKVIWTTGGSGWTLKANTVAVLPAGVASNQAVRLHKACYKPSETMRLTKAEPYHADDWWLLQDGRNGKMGSAIPGTTASMTAPTSTGDHTLWYGSSNEIVPTPAAAQAAAPSGSGSRGRVHYRVSSNCDGQTAPAVAAFSLNKKCYLPGETMTMTLKGAKATDDWWLIPEDGGRHANTGTATANANIYPIAPAAEGVYTMFFMNNDGWVHTYAGRVAFEVDGYCGTGEPAVLSGGTTTCSNTTCSWTSANLPITDLESLRVTAKIQETGWLWSEDYARVSYRIGTGSWVQFANLTGDVGLQVRSASLGASTGTTLQFKVDAKTNSSSETWAFKELRVYGVAVAN